jgi:monothiol glutaredoxin
MVIYVRLEGQIGHEWRIRLVQSLKNRQAIPIIQCNRVNEVSAVDVVERIKTQLSSHPVMLYMKGTPDFPQCGFSATAVKALNAVGAKFESVNIFEDPELREALKQYSNWPTYPQLYVKGELLGGCDIIVEMYKSGELQKVVSEAK